MKPTDEEKKRTRRPGREKRLTANIQRASVLAAMAIHERWTLLRWQDRIAEVRRDLHSDVRTQVEAVESIRAIITAGEIVRGVARDHRIREVGDQGPGYQSCREIPGWADRFASMLLESRAVWPDGSPFTEWESHK